MIYFWTKNRFNETNKTGLKEIWKREGNIVEEKNITQRTVKMKVMRIPTTKKSWKEQKADLLRDG